VTRSLQKPQVWLTGDGRRVTDEAQTHAPPIRNYTLRKLVAPLPNESDVTYIFFFMLILILVFSLSYIIIIIFINCNWVVTRWQWLFYMYTEYEIRY